MNSAYISDRKNLRLSTGVCNIDKAHLKNNILSHKVKDHFLKNIIIKEKLDAVNKIIEEYVLKYRGSKPSIDYIRELLNKPDNTGEAVIIKKKIFEQIYKDFYSSKQQEAIVPASLKDYISTYNALLAWQKHNKHITLELLNTVEFIQKFERFLSNPIGKIKFRGTKGGLNNNTIWKRISCLKTFLKWCEGKELIKRKFEIINYKSKVKKFQPTVVILSKEEQSELEQLQLSDDEEKLRDILLFLCKTGLRYSDLISLCKDEIKMGFIVREADKTRLKFKVPLSPKANLLLKKYNYNFNYFTTVGFNINIKLLLQKYNICCYPIQIRNVRYTEIERINVMKYTEISSHTGRRTFIAHCLMTGHTINQVMSYTGHRKVSSLQVYIDNFLLQDDAIKKINSLD